VPLSNKQTNKQKSYSSMWAAHCLYFALLQFGGNGAQECDLETCDDIEDSAADEDGGDELADYTDYIIDGDKLVSENSSLTKGQLYTLLYAYTLRHTCTEAAVSDLITLFNSVIPGCVPHSRYFFRKSLNKFMTDTLENHAYCSTCGTYLAKVIGSNTTVMCPECEVDVNCTEMVQKGNSFLVYPLKDQLQVLFEKTHAWKNIADSSASGKGCDISDGSKYQTLNIRFPQTITLTCEYSFSPNNHSYL